MLDHVYSKLLTAPHIPNNKRFVCSSQWGKRALRLTFVRIAKLN